MYKFTIDTDSKKLSSVDVYADAEKTTKLATPLDAVMRYKQTVRICFAGTRVPAASDSVKLVVAWQGLLDNALGTTTQQEAVATYIEHAGTADAAKAGEWTFDVDFNSPTLEAAIAKKQKVTMRGAVVVEAADGSTHVEYHFAIGATASIYAGALADPGAGQVA